MANKTQRSRLARLLEQAEVQLWADFEGAGVFAHNVVIGSAREGAVADFLRRHLPERFVITTGQAVDSEGNISTQLDIMIYDSYVSAPLLRSDKGPELLPAEALLAVVEVKTKFSSADAGACAKAACSLACLRPYGRRFVPSRSEGADASDRAPRCMYSIFAFDTDRGKAKWAEKEWARLRDAAAEASVDVERIDRLTVLRRGLLVPPTCTALAAEDDKGILRDWFLHLSDFLIREAARRDPYDWHRYAKREATAGWEKLDGYKSVNQAKRDRRSAQEWGAKGTS